VFCCVANVLHCTLYCILKFYTVLFFTTLRCTLMSCSAWPPHPILSLSYPILSYPILSYTPRSLRYPTLPNLPPYPTLPSAQPFHPPYRRPYPNPYPILPVLPVFLGYNGFPRGCSDDELPWARTADDELDTKYPVSLDMKGEDVVCARLSFQCAIVEIYHD
jgi:hypothetical protein